MITHVIKSTTPALHTLTTFCGLQDTATHYRDDGPFYTVGNLSVASSVHTVLQEQIHHDTYAGVRNTDRIRYFRRPSTPGVCPACVAAYWRKK